MACVGRTRGRPPGFEVHLATEARKPLGSGPASDLTQGAGSGAAADAYLGEGIPAVCRLGDVQGPGDVLSPDEDGVLDQALPERLVLYLGRQVWLHPACFCSVLYSAQSPGPEGGPGAKARVLEVLRYRGGVWEGGL